MEQPKFKQVNQGRRQFLNAAKGLGALGAIAVLAGKGASLEQVAATGTVPEASSSNYHETEHIRKYYHSVLY